MLLFAPFHSNVPGSTGLFASSRMSSADNLQNNLNRNQAQPTVGLDLDPYWLTLLWFSLRVFFKQKVLNKKSASDDKSMKNIQHAML